MRIIFVPQDCFPFHGKTIEERPLGGTETGVVRLAEALNALGHEVFCATPLPLEEIPFTPVTYLPYDQIQKLEKCDVLIAVRRWQTIFSNTIRSKTLFYWTGDMWNVISTVGIGDRRVINRLNGLFGVSNWQLKVLCEHSGYPLSRTFVLKNGVHLPYFEGDEIRQPKRLIFTSTPERGLIYMPKIFKMLKQIHPDLELHVFSSLNKYNLSWSADYDPQKDMMNRWDNLALKNQETSGLMQELSAVPGCFMHGSILQKQLAREFMKSAILAYPTNFNETSCITAMEAQAAGCPIVSTDIGAMQETVGEAGILIREVPGSEEYAVKFVNAVDRLLSDKDLYEKLSANAKRLAFNLSWENSAKKLLVYLKIFYGIE